MFMLQNKTAANHNKKKRMNLTLKINQVFTPFTSHLNDSTCCGWRSSDAETNRRCSFWVTAALRLLLTCTLMAAINCVSARVEVRVMSRWLSDPPGPAVELNCLCWTSSFSSVYSSLIFVVIFASLLWSCFFIFYFSLLLLLDHSRRRRAAVFMTGPAFFIPPSLFPCIAPFLWCGVNVTCVALDGLRL